MPDLTPAEHALCEVLRRLYDEEYDASGKSLAEFASEAREVLAAVAPVLRAEVAEEVARAIEAQDGGDQGLPSGRDGRAFYASVARQHATT